MLAPAAADMSTGELVYLDVLIFSALGVSLFSYLVHRRRRGSNDRGPSRRLSGRQALLMALGATVCLVAGILITGPNLLLFGGYILAITTLRELYR
jgi:hypothetical protein